MLFSFFFVIYLFIFIITILVGREWYLTVVSICISLITNDAGHVFHMLVSQLNTYFEECLFNILCPFYKIGLFILLLKCKASLYFLNMKPLSECSVLKKKKLQNVQRNRKVWPIDKEEIGRSHPWGSPDIRLSRQRLYINSLKYAERAKGNHE